MKTDPPTLTTRFQHYIVAYIDVLGQTAELAKLEKLLDDGKRSGESVLEAKRQTIDVIKEIRNNCFKYWKDELHSELSNPNYHSLTTEQKTHFKKLKDGDIKVRYISDGIIVYAPLVVIPGKQRVQDVMNILIMAAHLILVEFGNSVAIRGAIELGWATKFEGWTKNKEDADIYGPVLARVQWLESKVASYPRIVVGNRLIEYLKLRSQLPDEKAGNPQEKLNTLCEKHCHMLTCEDTDGQFIVDFLGEFMQEIVNSSDVKPLIILGYKFIKQEYIRYKQARDSKLAFRYGHLLNYYLERLPDLDPEALY